MILENLGLWGFGWLVAMGCSGGYGYGYSDIWFMVMIMIMAEVVACRGRQER